MSYHEISAVTKYHLSCSDCGFRMDAESAGAAEAFARDHIEEENKDNAQPNFDHRVHVYQFTAVGRQV